MCLQGVFISRVTEDGPAAKAGIKVGDKLLKVSAGFPGSAASVTLPFSLVFVVCTVLS